MDPTDSLGPDLELMSRDELRSKFGIPNYVVFIMMLLVSAIIGRQPDTQQCGSVIHLCISQEYTTGGGAKKTQRSSFWPLGERKGDFIF